MLKELKMPQKKSMGIYLYSNKTYYYLEAGDNHIGNTLDRVRKALIQRGLIQGLTDAPMAASYDILSYEEAIKKDYSLQPIFISKHIENMYKTKHNKNSGAFK